MTEYSLGQQTMLVCVDSYEGGVPRGRLYLPGQQGQRFDSLSQLLLRAEQLLEQGGAQSFTIPRIFALAKPLRSAPCDADELARGKAATFEMRVLFRQHASWQGELLWLEKDARQSFRSALELITLMDSALRAEGN
ncbi:MAG: hypothetical protein SPC78_06755 [Candidatus Faecousia sp.]|nr:hypothetical protein [Clostridiales bacterium]MDD5883634.1 hypothetical protein [Bacillota bacterium]MDY4599314.1 hypothetical protein [Candidatus Faecousia sp.]